MVKRLPRGALIAFEGIDGAGKTTQAHRLVEAVQKLGIPALYSKEPTEGPWGQMIRRSAGGERMPMEQELHAFVEDRRAHVRDVITPALSHGVIVVLDRYYFSNAAYQGARGADAMEIIERNERFAPQPDLMVFLDIPTDVAMERVRTRGYEVSSFERADALEQSATIFRSFVRPYILRLDGRRAIDAIASEVFDEVQRRALTDAADDGLPPLPPTQIAAALAEVRRIQTDDSVPADEKSEAIARALKAMNARA